MTMGHLFSRGVTRLKTVSHATVRLDRHLEDMKMLQGKIAIAANRALQVPNLRAYEFKVFSQWGEDGIIQRLIDVVPMAEQTFIEFGASDFQESNCRFLLMNNNWSGFVIDGSEKNVEKIKNADYYVRHDLVARASFIDRDNINDLLSESGFDRDLGILSVDIDGVDYHVLEAITSHRPRILITEINTVFGGERKITVPYDPTFYRTAKHYSNLYFGASLGAFDHLATKMGYSLVATTTEGINAFFIRNDVLPAGMAKLDYRTVFPPSRLRESRAPNGQLTHLRGDERLKVMRGLPVINVETGESETL
jgi:hypothetical protein